MPPGTGIPFFTDHNVQDSAGEAILQSGHDLRRLRDCMLPDSKDPEVAAFCAREGLVLVTHDRDFNGIAAKLKSRGETLHRVRLTCFEPNAAERLRVAISLIEHEWGIALRDDHSLTVEVGDRLILTRR